MKKKWNILSDKSERYQNENIIEYALRLRGIKDTERFLNPSFRDLISFESFLNLSDATDIVVDGILSQKKFCVHFDVDIDGITAGTIMYKTLKNHGATNVSYQINKGKIHGVSHKDISEFDDIEILIIVDSLDNDYVKYQQLKDKGIEIVILDHHEFDEYPENATLISSSKNYPNNQLSGSGVTWKFCYYFDSVFNTNYAKDLLDLAACGILGDVCDVSEGSFENRYIVSLGLNNLQNIGIKEVIGNYSFNSQSVIWSLAPLVNAANRTGNNQLAVDLFMCDDSKQIKTILKQLKEIKTQQDLTVTESFIEMEKQIDSRYNENIDKVVYGFVEEKDYSGLIATKAANKYCKPAIALYNVDDIDELKGSIRGFGIDNFKSIINSTKLGKAMGHESAAGFVCKKSNFNSLIRAINEKLKDVEFTLTQDVDLKIKYNDITERMISDLTEVNKISGKNFNPIIVGIIDLEVFNPSQMQNKHSKFNHYDLNLLKWNDVNLFKELDGCEGYTTIDVVGSLETSAFAGKKQIQMIVSDYDNITCLPDYLRNTEDNLD